MYRLRSLSLIWISLSMVMAGCGQPQATSDTTAEELSSTCTTATDCKGVLPDLRANLQRWPPDMCPLGLRQRRVQRGAV